jgi:hypothetical protein
MTCDDLSPEQCDALSEQIGPTLSYLGRLSKRMTNARFPHDDPLRVLVDRAEDAVHWLRIQTERLVGVHAL